LADDLVQQWILVLATSRELIARDTSTNPVASNILYQKKLKIYGDVVWFLIFRMYDSHFKCTNCYSLKNDKNDFDYISLSS
jgi:hypothetical protein